MTTPHLRRIGFISTRFAGTDGVSLETAKWAMVLEGLGHTCFYFAGQCDRPAERSRVAPEAYYRHPAIDALNTAAFIQNWRTTAQADAEHPHITRRDFFSPYVRPPHITLQIDRLKHELKQHLYAFAHDFDLELLIVENALTIPLNLPLGLALTEFILETGIPVIAHHHDFYWERQRFAVNCVPDYIAAAFPPALPSVRHVVINSVQANQLAMRVGVYSRVIPNVMDFDRPPEPPDDYARGARVALGLEPDEYFILQPTRIIQRKGIEHAIELTKRLGLKAKLVISHASGDEGTSYEQRVREFAQLLDVNVRFEADQVGDVRGVTPDGRRIYTLGDIYPQADLVTYPSNIEGFGNAFLEAVYYKRPIVVNNYSIYEVDIKPKGFRVVEFDGFISQATLQETQHLLEHAATTQEWAEHNYQLARRYFSFSVLERRLQALLGDCFGYTD